MELQCKINAAVYEIFSRQGDLTKGNNPVKMKISNGSVQESRCKRYAFDKRHSFDANMVNLTKEINSVNKLVGVMNHMHCSAPSFILPVYEVSLQYLQ